MLNTTSGQTLFTQKNPGVIRIEDLYVPTNTPATGYIIPAIGTLVVDIENDNTVYVVDATDPITHAATLLPARLFVSNTNPADSLTSVISYSNDIFRVYYDTRTSPIRIRPDSRIVIFGGDNVSYQLVLNPGVHQTVISRHYDASGNYTGPLCPLVPIVNSEESYSGAVSLSSCYVQTALTDNQEVFIQVFNSEGSQTALISTFAKASVIINEMITPDPVIIGVSITSLQSRANGEIFIYQNQSIESLGLQIVINYSDGHTRTTQIDQQQCFLYGIEDFNASFPGLQQTIMAKYFLSANEVVALDIARGPSNYISATASLIVVPNGLQAGVKISIVPTTNSAGIMGVNYFLYSTTRDRVINVSSMVTIDPTTPLYPQNYGQIQIINLLLDMSKAEPTIYSAPTIYQQQVVAIFLPPTATDRYTFADATNAPVVYGKTTTRVPRPVIHFDAILGQYYVPSSIFTTLAIFLQAFYINASPPYDPANESAAPTPTHFYIRDPSNGVMLTAAPMPIAQYQQAFSIIGAGLANRYAGFDATLIVEFVTVLSAQTTLILYGVCVDVKLGVYNG